MFKNCYHLCTKALEDKLLCYDKVDFQAIWNALIISAIVNGITLYCLCVMSNHIHVLLSGEKEQIARFFAAFKLKAGKHLGARYGKHTARELSYELFPVRDRKAFCQEVAYILRNPYKAGIASPLSYKWSSAGVYFNTCIPQGQCVSDIPSKRLRSILKTRFPLPGSLQIISGSLTPGSFIDREFVEKMFENSSVRFFNALKTWSIEDVVNASHGQDVPDAYTDEEVLRGIKDICRDTFNGMSPRQMDQKAMVIIVRRIRARFGCPRNQLLRLLPVDDALLDRAL
ncbi:MAG: hypothetical protein IKX37_01815 [Bacteroidales bacterium]|nr:hypothetical protein [Bacteroidales bacterium]